MRDVMALVLAGGRMSDYGVLTQNRAKGALTFAGSYRVIDFALSNLVNADINQIGIIIQYLPASLIEHVGVGQPWDLNGYGRMLKIMPPFVGMEKTIWYKGTADAIYQNLNFVDDSKSQDVIILSGEHVYHLDYRAVLESHRTRNADVTIVSKELPEARLNARFGYIVPDESGRVRSYHEKPLTPPSGIVSTGIYVFKSDILTKELQFNSRESDHNLAKDILERRAGQLNCYEFRTQDHWEYLETVEDYFDAQFRLMGDGYFEPLRRWNIMTNLDFRGAGFAPPPYIGGQAVVENSMVSPGCRIEGQVINSILSPGVHVHAGAVVRDSILMHDCIVQGGALLVRVISDRDAVFGADCVIGDNTAETKSSVDPQFRPPLTLIGKGVQIAGGVRIPSGAEIRPGRVVANQEAANTEIAAPAVEMARAT